MFEKDEILIKDLVGGALLIGGIALLVGVVLYTAYTLGMTAFLAVIGIIMAFAGASLADL